MVRRNLEERIERELESFPAVVLIGSRQCGKTTLAKMLRPDWKYVDLEKSSDYEFVRRDFDFFFATHPAQVVFDEVQMMPELLAELRGVIDADRGRKGRFLLTGSCSPSLLQGVVESLAGRVAVIEVGTLKLNEIHNRGLPPVYGILTETAPDRHLESLGGLKPDFTRDEVLNHFLAGGYPEPALCGDADFQARWMVNYERTYLDRDVRELFPRLNVRNFRRFLRMLCELSGTIVNRSEIGRSLGASEGAVRDYLDIAEGTFLWRSLGSLEKTASKSLVKMPRGYVRDSGLLCHLKGIRTLEQALTWPGMGSAFEGFLIEEILLGLGAVEVIPWSAAYYRTRGGAEVDLVLTHPSGVRIPVEIKLGMSTKRSDWSSLSAFIEQEGCPYGILVNNSEKTELLAPRILRIPAGCF
jgi:hypothetical protein